MVQLFFHLDALFVHPYNCILEDHLLYIHLIHALFFESQVLLALLAALPFTLTAQGWTLINRKAMVFSFKEGAIFQSPNLPHQISPIYINKEGAIFQSPNLPHQISPIYINKNNGIIATLASKSTQISNRAIRCDILKSSTTVMRDHQQLVDLLHQCAENKSHTSTKAVHGFVLRASYVEDDLVVLLNHIAYAYSKCSDFNAARDVFDNMLQRNTFSWTVMILGSIENGLFQDSFEFFREMQNQEIAPDKFSYSAIVKLCIHLHSIELGESVHARIIKAGFANHIFVLTSLLNMYAKLGDMEGSLNVFNSMMEPNEVSWNAVISGFTKNGLYSEAYEHYLKMKKITPNVYTFIAVLKAVGKLQDLEKGKQVHNHVSKLGMERDVVIGTAIIDMYGKCGSVSDARSVFDANFTDCQSSGVWNSMISAYSHCGCNKEALEVFMEMCRKSVRCDRFTYCSIFNVVAALKSLQILREIHGKALKLGNDVVSVDVSNAIADAYAKCGLLEDVEKVIGTAEDRDLVSWTTLVSAYSQCNEEEKAIHAFLEMKEQGLVPNQYTFSSVLAACATLSALDFGHQLHGLICKSSLDSDKCIESSLIEMYSKCGNIAAAEKVFNSVENPDIVTWTSMISSYAQHGLVSNAVNLFKKLENNKSIIKPNAVTFLSVLFACSHGGLVDEGLHYFRTMKETYNLVPKMEHYACIVDLLGRVGRIDEAVDFIKCMDVQPGEMVWQSLLGACKVHRNIEVGKIAAEKILGVMPENPAAYILLSNTYMRSGRYGDGVSIREAIRARGMKKEPGCSWISVKGKVHKFYSGDQQHAQRVEVYAVIDELRLKLKDLGYVPDLSCVL